MRFVAASAVALAIAFLCARPLKNIPLVFYACALAADMLYAYAVTVGASGGFWAVFLPLMQRCTLAMALFAVVMFTGTLKDGSTVKARLIPIRRQLSIMGCILALCHVVFYASTYIMQVAGIIAGSTTQPGIAANLFVSLVISLLITALLLVLTATSFLAIKARMKGSTWKKIQRLAYLFYALVFVHLAIILTPPALAGKEAAVESICVYAILFITYAALRIRRHALDKRNGKRRLDGEAA